MSENRASRPGLARQSVEQSLEATAQWNPLTNAILTPFGEQARRDADELDRRAASGDWPGLLYGMTVAVKDNIDVAGHQTTAGGVWLKDHVPEQDATVIRRLRQHGATLIGKANLHEGAFGPTSQNEHFGDCLNPWDQIRIAGGSSGGSGVAVATGMSAGALGTDTGGSVRIPASYNGICGLRPTHGLVSNHGTFPVSRAFDAVGPMARSVRDVARMLIAIAGFDSRDPLSIRTPGLNLLDQLDGSCAGLRIGIMRRHFFEGLDPELESALEDALRIFRDLGMEPVDVDLGPVEDAKMHMAFNMVVADAYALHRPRLETQRTLYGADLLKRYDRGAAVTGADYANAMRWMEDWRSRLAATFEDVDVILSPTTPTAAPVARDAADPVGTVRNDITRYTFCWAFAGVPTLALPCGYTEGNLPLGMQLTGAWHAEGTLLRIGEAFQRVTTHHQRKPSLPASNRNSEYTSHPSQHRGSK